ncbi:hypothetical protein BP6252_09884 [Coleophoma cylindrospora]|uniref:Uncharacterized protein n=1 Tax=Coleophoma cylindrospora TaxID=1849047 RepID=A0A3D8QWW6_9HELO|nr:hypothetical protein BP6252_09884 [Coleophoma cylindrospora]
MATVPYRAFLNAGNSNVPSLFQFQADHPQPPSAPTTTTSIPTPQSSQVSPLMNVKDIANAKPHEQMPWNSRLSIAQNSDRAASTATSAPKGSVSPATFNQQDFAGISSPPTSEGVLVPNKDGRVRNPVPSKLKNKTDGKKGTFGVMHMDLTGGKKGEMAGKDIAAERDAAARRTSEKTASAAKAAQQDGYIPPKRRRIGGTEELHAQDRVRPARPLAPDETKQEQARLLTLLRSINPVTVVDQLCKAVAYFGGIPGAPPPEDGIFPESANTRETGALFIGWLAEIFPDLSKAPSPEVPKLQDPPKRSRGRPRKDMSDEPADSEPIQPRITQSSTPQVARPSWSRPSLVGAAGDGWAQIAGMENHNNFTIPGMSANTNVVAPQDTSKAPQMDSTRISQGPVSTPAPATPNPQQASNLQTDAASTNKRGRGRPKGSTKKSKEQQGEIGQTGPTPMITVGPQQNDFQQQQTHSNRATEIKPPTSGAAPTREEEQRALIAHQQSLLFGKPLWAGQTNSAKATSNSSPFDGLSPEERAVLEAFRSQRTQGPASKTIIEKATHAVPSGGVKRKRAPPNKSPALTNINATSTIPVAEPTPASKVPETAPSEVSKDTLQWNAVETSAPAVQTSPSVSKESSRWISPQLSNPTVPPSKRQRKPKDPNAPQAKRKTGPMPRKDTPPSLPSTIPDSTVGSSQQSAPSRPPAEGLEAHYERFANLQQNGRSSTPNVPNVPQRQNTSAQGSVGIQRQNTPSQPLQPPQKQQQAPQQKPQLSQPQQQSQQAATQQSEKTADQAINQSSSTRPTSAAYYNQTRYTPYSQQYPSHQPPQQYSTQPQASPRMSSSNISARPGSTHTLARPSPQFSQTQPETTYRTASPHNLTQASPSFPQTDNSYRSSTANSVAQPSPLYAPAVPQTQTSQSHQNHYGGFANSSYIDLPTLESLDHGGTSSHSNVNLNTNSYGHSMGLGGMGASSRAGNTAGSYGPSSGLASSFNPRVTQSGGHGGYNTTSSLNNSFDTGTGEQDMRERLLRGLGHR